MEFPCFAYLCSGMYKTSKFSLDLSLMGILELECHLKGKRREWVDPMLQICHVSEVLLYDNSSC